MSAVAINVFTFNIALAKLKKPLISGDALVVPPRGAIDGKLLGGAAIFGLGWGLTGLCPGPAVIIFFSMTHGIVFVASLVVGQYAFDHALTQFQSWTSKVKVIKKAPRENTPYTEMVEQSAA